MKRHLIPLQLTFTFFIFTLLLKGQDDQGNENIQKEERENDDKEDEEQCHLNLVVQQRSTVNPSCIYCIEHNTEIWTDGMWVWCLYIQCDDMNLTGQNIV